MTAAADVAAPLLGEPVRWATVADTAEIVYDPFLPGRSVASVTGEAGLRNGTVVPWSAIVKRSRRPGLRSARREVAAYRGGLTGPSSALRAPALLAAADDGERIDLWLEPMRDRYDGRWPIEQYGIAAQDIGARDAAMAGADTGLRLRGRVGRTARAAGAGR